MYCLFIFHEIRDVTKNEEPTLMMAVAEEYTPSEVFLMEEKISVHLLATGEPRVESDVWYLDNVASNHMTWEHLIFYELDKRFLGRVKFGGGSTLTIMGKGSILFDYKNDDQLLLNKVYFIPKLKK